MVPFSGAGFVMGTAVHIFNLKKYKPIVKNAIFLGSWDICSQLYF